MTPSETSPPATEAEFSPEENAVFAALGLKMQFVGGFALGLGLVAVLMGLSRHLAGPLLAGVLYAIIGHWTSRAGKQFRIIPGPRAATTATSWLPWSTSGSCTPCSTGSV